MIPTPFDSRIAELQAELALLREQAWRHRARVKANRSPNPRMAEAARQRWRRDGHGVYAADMAPYRTSLEKILRVLGREAAKAEVERLRAAQSPK